IELNPGHFKTLPDLDRHLKAELKEVLKLFKQNQVLLDKVKGVSRRGLENVIRLNQNLIDMNQQTTHLAEAYMGYETQITAVFGKLGYSMSHWAELEWRISHTLIHSLKEERMESKRRPGRSSSPEPTPPMVGIPPHIEEKYVSFKKLLEQQRESYLHQKGLVQQFLSSLQQQREQLKHLDPVISAKHWQARITQWNRMTQEGLYLVNLLNPRLSQQSYLEQQVALAQLQQHDPVANTQEELLGSGIGEVLLRIALTNDFIDSHKYYARQVSQLEDQFNALITELEGYRSQEYALSNGTLLDQSAQNDRHRHRVVMLLLLLVALFIVLFFRLLQRQLLKPCLSLTQRTGADNKDQRVRAIVGSLPLELMQLDENTRRMAMEITQSTSLNQTLAENLKSTQVAQQIMEKMQVGVVVMNLEGRISQANQAFLDLFQLDRGEVYQQLLGHVAYGLLDQAEIKQLMMMVEGGRMGENSSTVKVPHPDLGEMMVEIGGFGSQPDEISEHDHYEDQDREFVDLIQNSLHAANHKISILSRNGRMEDVYAILDEAPIGVVMVGSAGDIQYANPFIHSLLGYHPEELEGQSVHQLVPDAVSMNHQQLFSDYVNSGVLSARPMSEQRELMGKHKDGQLVDLQIGLIPTEHKGNRAVIAILHDVGSSLNWFKMSRTPFGRLFTEVDQIVLTFQDVTEKTLLRQRESIARKEVTQTAYQAGLAEMSSNMLHNIGNAVGVLSHKTENFSNSIETLTDVEGALRSATAIEDVEQLHYGLQQSADLLLEVIHSGLKESSREISKGVEHISDIVRIQQEMARGDASLAVTFNLLSTIKDTAMMQEDLNNKYRIQLSVDVHPDLSDVVLPQNPFVQMIDNFIKNGREAIIERQQSDSTAEGKIDISVTPGMHDQLILRVRDSGIGVDPRKLKEIFKHGVTTKEQGSGFGLHSASTFAQSIGGTIEMKSEGKNKGATMVVKLPIEVSNQS
ncbi:MAG: PAS domain S-box protein, partial [Gammaproteobacteria bacterium]|nr:PAS domain S-box protein [Gammaproteobacteria bacterium]